MSGLQSYAYNEEAMLRGINTYRAEQVALRSSKSNVEESSKPKDAPSPQPSAVDDTPAPIPPRLEVNYAKHAMRSVCAVFDVSSVELMSGCRERRISTARAATAYLLRTRTELSLEGIGRRLDLHHTSILSAVRRFSRLLDDSLTLRTQYAVAAEMFDEATLLMGAGV